MCVTYEYEHAVLILIENVEKNLIFIVILSYFKYVYRCYFRNYLCRFKIITICKRVTVVRDIKGDRKRSIDPRGTISL